MKNKLRKADGRTVFDIIPERQDNIWEIGEFNRFIDDANERGVIFVRENIPNDGDVVRILIKPAQTHEESKNE